jgi:hypothetical protein
MGRTDPRTDIERLEGLTADLNELATYLNARAEIPWSDLLNPVGRVVAAWRDEVVSSATMAQSEPVSTPDATCCRSAARRAARLAQIAGPWPSDAQLLNRLASTLEGIAEVMD